LTLFAEILVVAAAMTVLAGNLGAPLFGAHLFRQAHVISNIELFVTDGHLLLARSYDGCMVPAMYDLPVYQWIVWAICKLLGANPLVTARAVNLVLFGAACWIIHRLLTAGRFSPIHRLLALALFAWAPLNLAYFSAPMVDCLAVVASLGAVHLLVRIEEQSPRRGSRRLLIGMGLMGLTAAAIKPTVVFPAAIGVLVYAVVRYRWRGLVHGPAGLLALSRVTGIVLQAVIRKAVNGDLRIGNERPWWIFGPLAQRLVSEHWSRILECLCYRILNPINAWLLAPGVVLFVWRSTSAVRWLFTGWCLGVVVYVLTFFNLSWRHDYYLLPLVFPLVFFVGYLVASALEAGGSWLAGRRGRRQAAGALLTGGYLAILAVGAWHFWAAMKRGIPARAMATGAWIRDHTGEDDFVLYAGDFDAGGLSPHRLYFARRHGISAPIEGLTMASLLRVYSRHQTDRVRDRPYGRFVIFAEPGAAERVGRLAAGLPLWESVIESDRGTLFVARAK